jgi:hypothetical protein
MRSKSSATGSCLTCFIASNTRYFGGSLDLFSLDGWGECCTCHVITGSDGKLQEATFISSLDVWTKLGMPKFNSFTNLRFRLSSSGQVPRSSCTDNA